MIFWGACIFTTRFDVQPYDAKPGRHKKPYSKAVGIRPNSYPIFILKLTTHMACLRTVLEVIGGLGVSVES